MKISIYRDLFYDNATIGQLFIDGMFACHTLEPHAINWARQKKEFGKTAIPSGTYNIVLSPSAKYKALMPYLEDVPYFSGVMIHPGNFAKDTQGCILVGWHYWQNVIGVYDSRKTFAPVLAMIKDAYNRSEPIVVEVCDRLPLIDPVEIHPAFTDLYHNFTRVRYGKKTKVNAKD